MKYALEHLCRNAIFILRQGDAVPVLSSVLNYTHTQREKERERLLLLPWKPHLMAPKKKTLR